MDSLLAEGDSITTNDIATSYASLFHAAYPSINYHNTAVSASTLTNLTSRAATDDALIVPGGLNVMSVLVGANDLNSSSAATFLSNLATYLDARRSAGWLVVLCTVLPRNEAGSAGFEAKRQASNPTMRTWPGVHCDAIVDFDTTTMGLYASCLDSTLYGDGLHPTALGQSIMYPAYAPVLIGIQLNKVLPPAISIAPGTYNNDVAVALACATSGASIRYTTDGSTPSASSTLYSGSFNITASGTLKVAAFKTGMASSIVTSCDVALAVATPAFSPVAGSYGVSQNVSITSATTGASIYYTTDGSTPSASSTPYTGPITVSASQTLKAIAIKTGYTSASASASYAIASFVAATGGTVTTDGDYKVHTFTIGDTLTVTQGGNVRYLIVGGGGGGGSFAAGGGGAGGVLDNGAYDHSVTTGSYSIVVGSGGIGGLSDFSTPSTDGGDSSFDGLVAKGGGRGAGGNTSTYTAHNGGSGGGGAYQAAARGNGTAGQGNMGGTSDGNTDGGGGGGAGGLGGNGAGGNVGGVGGVGVDSDITGSAMKYGGGGGGASNGSPQAAGGLGGGGKGGINGVAPEAGTDGLGGGGGGGYLNAGAAGGKGVVVIRYKFQ
jgi:lysophospholipase L1-like esterase